MTTIQLNCVFCTFVLALAACHGDESKPVEAGQPKTDGVSLTYAPGTPELAAIVTETASEANAIPLRLSGRLAWNDDFTVQVFSPFAGRVERVRAQLGDRVKKGQALATVASPEFGQAQSDAKRTQADFSVAEQGVRRARELFQGGVIAQKELASAEADFTRTEAELKRTKARMAQYGDAGTGVSQEFALDKSST